MKFVLLLTTTSLLLSGCLLTTADHEAMPQPANWVSTTENVSAVQAPQLKNWWKGFNDPVLDRLVDKMLAGSPDRNIAKARLLEARGIRQAAKSSLFPEIGASAGAGREKSAATDDTGNFYQAGFDASYELDLFGRNRNTSNAAESNEKSLEAEYENISLSLAAEVARTYIEFRANEKQAAIAQKNLEAQQKTLELVTHQKEMGEAPKLDVERAQGLVNTTKSDIPEYLRLADNARLRLSVLTGALPEEVLPILAPPSTITSADIKPVLLTPAEIISLRPDIRAAEATLEAQTSLTKASIANIFPTITLGAFFGVADSVLIDPTNIWSGTLNAAVSLLNFGRISGNIDAAKAREMQAYELWRKTVLQAVTDVETALTDYSRIHERHVLLVEAAKNAEQSLTLSQELYKEGEISFLDVLDAQRTTNNANSAVVTAESAQAQSLIALYKSLGVY